MAFSILVELNAISTDWKDINKKINETSNGVLELFPIPKFPKTGRDYIGVSIPSRDFAINDLESIRASIKQLLRGGHKVIELYSSSEFTMETVDILTNKFFKTR
jgi:hypothetical protein